MIKASLIALLLLLTLVSPFVGSVSLDLETVFETGTIAHQIFFELRLPRLVLAFFSGALLALSGWLFQTLFRNGLMTPYTLGISGGAVLGTGIATVLGFSSLVFGVSFSAFFGFMGALSSVALLLWLSRYIPDKEGNSLLLLGIALSFFFSATLKL